MSEKKPRKKMRPGRIIKRWLKRILLLIALCALALLGAKAYLSSKAQSAQDEETYATAIVQRGAIEDTVYGSGTTSARSQPSVLAGADGTLTSLRVAVGDDVKKGDILAVMTNEDIDSTITDLEFALWDLDDTILGTAAGSKVSIIEAPVAGRVRAIYANVGDDALAVFRREGALAVISTDGRMKVELVGEDAALDLTLGERVRVTGAGIDEEGTVVDLTQQGTHATITVNDDTLPMDVDVTVAKEDGTAIGQGTLEINKPVAVSSFGGTIQAVRVAVGDKVDRRDTIFRLEDYPLSLTIEDLRLQREAAAKELADAKAQRENLIVLAPCDGVVATLEVSEGDEITSGTLIGSILEGEDMNLTIAVDELDVVDVEIGQDVVVTVDALGDVTMDGTVSKIAPVGTNSGGVTTYDVELAIDAAGTGVRSGMNATGEIIVDTAEDALYVPVEALMTVNNQTYVMAADGSAAQAGAGFAQDGARTDRKSAGDGTAMPQMSAGDDAQQTDGEGSMIDLFVSKAKNAYAAVKNWLLEDVNAAKSVQQTGTMVRVEVGLQNEEYAQIVSGVSEGDVVLYTSEETDTRSMFGGMGGGDMGGGRGGMGGGMPGF